MTSPTHALRQADAALAHAVARMPPEEPDYPDYGTGDDLKAYGAQMVAWEIGRVCQPALEAVRAALAADPAQEGR